MLQLNGTGGTGRCADATAGTDRLDDLCDLWYTSGTTGAPKGIMITHRNILTCTQMLLCDVYDISQEDKLLTVGALSHAGSVRDEILSRDVYPAPSRILAGEGP